MSHACSMSIFPSCLMTSVSASNQSSPFLQNELWCHYTPSCLLDQSVVCTRGFEERQTPYHHALYLKPSTHDSQSQYIPEGWHHTMKCHDCKELGSIYVFMNSVVFKSDWIILHSGITQSLPIIPCTSCSRWQSVFVKDDITPLNCDILYDITVPSRPITVYCSMVPETDWLILCLSFA